MKIVMYPHAGCYNHGCEAIVRSTATILGKDNELYLYTSQYENDSQFAMDKVCKLIQEKEYKNNFFTRKLDVLKEKLGGIDRDTAELIHKHRKVFVDKKMIGLSIGGDNYCYPGMQHILGEYTKIFSAKNIPTVLWGCSLESKYMNPKTVEELKAYSIITARESLTIEALGDVGITNNVIACSDPAFTLNRQAINWNDDILATGNVIGVNVSPLMDRYNAYPDATYKNYYRLLEYLLKETDSYIAMIPHVRQKRNDDLEPIKKLAQELNSERILVVSEDYNCMQLKDIIARCKMFIGCRTHSTIAAYSTCVPTLVVGYSVKARGIAKDIFGDYDDLLVDVRNFENDDDLLKKFLAFNEREEELRKYMQDTMPAYIEKAYNAKEAIQKLR